MGRRSRLVAASLASVVLATSPGAAPAATDLALDPLGWRPGLSRVDVEGAMRRSGVPFVARGPRQLVVETPLLPEVYAPQRGLLEFDSGSDSASDAGSALASFTVHLNPLDPSSASEVDDLYAESRDLLLRRLGRPEWVREEGTRGSAAFAASDGEGWLRCIQWRSEATFRLGIPRLPSGALRVEVRMVAGELPPPESYWGKEF